MGIVCIGLLPVLATLLISWNGVASKQAEETLPTPGLESPKRPNILIIMDDQHSARALGCAGNTIVKTPRLDQLASEGAYFRQAYCNDPVCGPSRYSMMSGRYPAEIGTFMNSYPPNPDVRFLADYASDWGYFTGSSGKDHFTPKTSTHGYQEIYRHSFYNCDDYSNYTPWYEKQFEERGLEGEPFFWASEKGWADRMDTENGLCTINPNPADISPEHWITQKALRLIDQASEQDKPFFVHASYFAPHHPYGPLQEFYDIYDGVEMVLPESFYGAKNPGNGFTEAQFKDIMRHYYGFVSQVDHYIGELLDGLEERGLAGDTLVIMVSDHGDMMGEFADLQKGDSREGSLAVPFFVRWPNRVPANTVIDAPVSLIDILPTVFEAVGEAPPAVARGTSVLPLIDGTDDGLAREVYSIDVRREPFLLVVAREYRWKLAFDGRGSKPPKIRLHDIIEDPWELDNRAADPELKEVRDRLKRKAWAFWDSQEPLVPRPMPQKTLRNKGLDPLGIKD